MQRTEKSASDIKNGVQKEFNHLFICQKKDTGSFSMRMYR